MDETEELIKIAAEPHLITTAGQAHQVLGRLNSLISHLRLEVSELELKADLHLNELFKTSELAIDKTKALWKVSEQYLEFKTKNGLLVDIRAIRRNLERHAEMLSSQERFGNYKTPNYLG